MLRFLALAMLLALTQGFMGPMVPTSKLSRSLVTMKGFGGAEATRDPAPTVIDPSDPKSKQNAIHKAVPFAEYLASRNNGFPDMPEGSVKPTAKQTQTIIPPAPQTIIPPAPAAGGYAEYMAKRDAPAAVAPVVETPAPAVGGYAEYMAKRDAPAAVAPVVETPAPAVGGYAEYMAKRNAPAAVAPVVETPAPEAPAPAAGGYAEYMAKRNALGGAAAAPNKAPAAAPQPVAAVKAKPKAPELSEEEKRAQRRLVLEREAAEDAALPPLPAGFRVEFATADGKWPNGRTGVVRNFDAERQKYFVWVPHEPIGTESSRDRPMLYIARRAHMKQA